MAIKTGAIFNSLTFGGINSADYGVYITGEAVYNAPQRAVEMVAVPGRNGAIALDQGRWENITVSYPAGTFETDQTKFASAIAAFRNALVSLKGYQRLTDTYNPNEYRMGLFMDGIEVAPVQSKAGEFTISFNCKPQRWLTSGETEVTLSDGDNLTNPTLFAANPVFAVKGYGTIEFNGYEIELNSGSYGTIELSPAGVKTYSGHYALQTQIAQKYTFNSDLFDPGDVFTVGASSAVIKMQYKQMSYDEMEFSNLVGRISQSSDTSFAQGDYGQRNIITQTWTIPWSGTTGGTTVTGESVYTLTLETRYTNTENIYVIASITHVSGVDNFAISLTESSVSYGALTVASSKTYLGDPTYIDCELGECYAIENDTVVDLNSYVDLGSDLPNLAPGSNTIDFDNTITELKITPGWWKL